MATSERGRGVMTIRILKLRRHLDGRRYIPSLAALAAEFNVTDRTIRRDLKTLEEAHEPLPIWRTNSERDY